MGTHRETKKSLIIAMVMVYVCYHCDCSVMFFFL